MEVNLTGTFHCCQVALPDMIEAKWGRIVMISSSSAQRGSPGMAHYAASKGALISLTKSLAREYGPIGITVNNIPPSGIETPMQHQGQAAGHLPSNEQMAASIPLGHLGTGDDIAAAVGFLCSEEAGFITGQTSGRQRRVGDVRLSKEGVRMARWPKPAEGSWTEHYPELGTGPVSFRDSTSPEFYELERDAVFKRAWLNVGRVEELPRVGSYFTKEIDAARASVIVVKGKDRQVRAFYNVCRHRGNKLVWNDFPNEETKGSCRQFTCKYHAWRYDLEGALTFVQQPGEFFDLDNDGYGLRPGATATSGTASSSSTSIPNRGRLCASSSGR